VEFNIHICNIINDFAAYGASCDELQANVLLAYKKVEDEQFMSFAELMMIEWNLAPGMPLHTFISQAVNEYNTRIQMGDWKAPTRKDLEITALKVFVAKYQKQTPQNSDDSGSNKSNQKGKKSYEMRLSDEKASHPWKCISSSKGEIWSKVVNKNTYHRCSKHQKWVSTHTDAHRKGIKSTPIGKTSNGKVSYKASNDSTLTSKNDIVNANPTEVKVYCALNAFTDAGSYF
jgi:hypothetical protein